MADTTVATVDTASLTFTAADFDTRQSVTITGVGNTTHDDGFRLTTLTLAGSGADFDGVTW